MYSSKITNSENPNDPFTIDQLIIDLIGECASYLYFEEYCNFYVCNKAIYKALQSSPQLQMLNMEKNGYPPIKILNKFPFLKGIHIDPAEFNRKYNDTDTADNIKQLRLDALSVTNEFKSRNHDDVIKKFMNTKFINFSEIIELTCYIFGDHESSIWGDNNRYNFGAFCEFLRKFPKVKVLKISGCFFTEEKEYYSLDKMKELLPELQFVAFYNGASDFFRNKLITAHSQTLVRIEYDERTADIDIGAPLKMLKDLTVISPNIQSFERIIKSANNLEKIMVDAQDISDENINQFCTIITSIFLRYSVLNQFYLIMSWKHFITIIECVEKGLAKATKTNHDYIRLIICIMFDEFDLPDLDIIGDYIKRIIKPLSCHWMLKLYLKCKEEWEITEIIIDEQDKNKMIQELRTKYIVNDQNFTDAKFDRCLLMEIIISNKNCKINGYHTIYDRLYKTGCMYPYDCIFR